MERAMQIPAAKSRDTWLAPRMESLPKMLMSTASRAISTIKGMKARTARTDFFMGRTIHYRGQIYEIILFPFPDEVLFCTLPSILDQPLGFLS